MGEYFVIANHSKKEYLHPHRFGDGLKFFELVAASAGTLAGLGHLLQSCLDEDKGPIRGRWVGDTVAIVGDYSQSGEFETAIEEYEDISFDVMREMCKDATLRAMLDEKTKWLRNPVFDACTRSPEEGTDDDRKVYRELFK